MFLNSLLLHMMTTTTQPTGVATQQTTAPFQLGALLSDLWSFAKGLLLPAIISFAVSYITTTRKLLREKRSEAKLKIHPQLNIALKELDQTNKNLSKGENPYCLLYDENVIFGSPTLKIPGKDYDECMSRYDMMRHIKELIDNPNNVYPPKVKKTVWEANVRIIRFFAELIVDAKGFQSLHNESDIHLTKLADLNSAVDDLIQATEYAIGE